MQEDRYEARQGPAKHEPCDIFCSHNDTDTGVYIDDNIK